MKKIIFLFLTLLSFSLYAQRSCGTEAYMKQKLEDPTFRAKYEAKQALFKLEYQRQANKLSSQKATIRIPVAIHFPDESPTDRACLEAMSQAQIDILNADYTGSNTDISLWATASTHYPGVNTGSLDVRFELATTNHPAGMGLTEGNVAVTIGYNFGGGTGTDANWVGYINILVKNIDGQGVAPTPGSPANGDSVEIDHKAFGTGSGCGAIVPEAPYNLGRTATHEVGHYLNLLHTWGLNGGCNEDDEVSDTPNIDDSTSGCPTPGSVVMCGNKSLIMNYMDYPDDSCMYMFTQGQMTRSSALLNIIVPEFKANVLSESSFEFEKSFAVLSNPAKDELRLRTSNNMLEENAIIQIFDLNGRSVLKSSLDNNLYEQKVNVSTLKSGLYIIKITSGFNELDRKIVIR